MIPINNFEIRHFDSQYDRQLNTIPQEDIINVGLTERTGRRKDDGSITLINDDDTYTDEITCGNCLEVRAKFAGDHLSPWGSGTWGQQKWGGMRTIWTARVRDQTFKYDGQQCNLELDCEDWVFSRFSAVNITDEFKDVAVSKIIDRIVNVKTPEIRPFVSNELNQKIEIKFDGDSLFNALDELLAQSGAEARAWKNHLIVKPQFDDSPNFTAQTDDMFINEVLKSDQELATFVKLHGGQAVTQGAHYVTEARYYNPITSDEREIFQIETEKSELAQLDIKLSSTKEPPDSPIKVRLQKSEDGGPIAPDDTTKDITSAKIEYEDILKHYRGEEGYRRWVTLNFPEHDLPEPNPWAIIEVEGEAPQRIVYDTEMVPNHIPYFPYQIIATDIDYANQIDYGRREKRVEATHVNSDREADNLAARTLNKYNQLDKVVKGRVKTLRMHNLRPGDVVTVDYPERNVNGDFILRERSATYEGMKLDTKVTLENDT